MMATSPAPPCNSHSSVQWTTYLTLNSEPPTNPLPVKITPVWKGFLVWILYLTCSSDLPSSPLPVRTSHHGKGYLHGCMQPVIWLELSASQTTQTASVIVSRLNHNRQIGVSLWSAASQRLVCIWHNPIRRQRLHSSPGICSFGFSTAPSIA